MLKFALNPELRIIRFDGSPANREQIKDACDAVVEKFHGFFWLKRKMQVSAADAAAGWSGGVMSQKIEVGDYITIYSINSVFIIKPKEFDRFFVAIN